MTGDFPTLDDVIDYRRRRLIGQLDALAGGDAEQARAEAERLLLEYLGDERVAAAFGRAVGDAHE